MNAHTALIGQMIKYFEGDPKRIQHFIKVHSLAKLIGEMEMIPDDMLYILEVASITHDIGIKNSEKKYGDCNGHHQETEGPPEADLLLSSLHYERDVINRVCWLIAHHHTYTDITDTDHQILVEADFLVNMYEDNEPYENIVSVYKNIFKTKSGKSICENMYGINKSKDELSSNESYERLKILKGYAVTERCVQCRSCIDVCPVQCINGNRKPVYIDQEKCLRCGTCAGVCDHHAIVNI
jgi:NAD-dependent dihydropyrimidine dehydrogenase PreA subunit